MMAPTIYSMPPPVAQAPWAMAPGLQLLTAAAAPCNASPSFLLPQVAAAAPATVGPSPSPPGHPHYPMSVTLCMEVVWHGEFTRLFSTFSNSWTLVPVAAPPSESSYKLFQDSAKVRFSCGGCGRGWTSMKGRVAFWFRMDPLTQAGEVLFKLYGQQCQKCEEGGTEEFHHAMWYPEEVVKVVHNLYNRVGTAYYGFQLPPIRIDRRTGKPRAQHDAKLCQACKDGICKEAWTVN